MESTIQTSTLVCKNDENDIAIMTGNDKNVKRKGSSIKNNQPRDINDEFDTTISNLDGTVAVKTKAIIHTIPNEKLDNEKIECTNIRNNIDSASGEDDDNNNINVVHNDADDEDHDNDDDLSITSDIDMGYTFVDDDDSINFAPSNNTQCDNNTNPLDVIHNENLRLSQMLADNNSIGRNSAKSALNGSSATPCSTLENRKRKMVAISVSLKQFVYLISDIFEDMSIKRDVKQMSLKRKISSYVEDCSSPKQFKLDKLSVLDNKDIKDPNPKVREEFSNRMVNYVVNVLFSWYEAQNANFLFPKEILRYFLASHSKFIKPVDFIDTNLVAKSDKRGKNTAQLINGAILYEYVKGFDTFVSSMSRSDTSDIDALKYIVQKQIKIPLTIYEPLLDITFMPKPHTQDINYTPRENYSQITITNNKQMFVLITKNVIMVYDGVQFVVPNANTEREFNTTMRQKSKLDKDDYMLLDIMFAVKIRVIDVLQYRINKKTTLPSSYSERMKLIQSVLPNLRLANISPQVANVDCSYIQKPNEGFGTSYIYHKSNLTAAAIGLIDKNVVIAFYDPNEDALVVKNKIAIVGSVSYMLLIMPSELNHGSTILMDKKNMRIIGDLKNVSLFKRVIPVELKDGNRLGLLSNRSISDVSEYKPNTVRKESAVLDDITKQISLNPELLAQILIKATSTSVHINEETKNIIRNLVDPKIDISFNGYGSQF